MSPVTLKELKNFARTIVDPLMVDGFDKVLAGELPTMVKLDKTLVSKVDKDINQAVIGYFSQFSDLDIIGEEDDVRRPGALYMLMCDPVDGTMPFTNGHGLSSFCVAVLERISETPLRYQSLMSVIYEPNVQGKPLWSAMRGQGAILDLSGGRSKKLRVSAASKLKSGFTIMSWYWPSLHKYDFSPLFDYLTKQGFNRHEAVGMASQGVRVALGTTVAALYAGTSGLEAAAMQPIIEEAGGRATDLKGEPLLYDGDGNVNGHLMTNGLVHEEMLELIKKYTITNPGY